MFDSVSLTQYSQALTPATGNRPSTSIKSGDHGSLTLLLTWSGSTGPFLVLVEHADRDPVDGDGPGVFSAHQAGTISISGVSGTKILQIDRDIAKEFVRVNLRNTGSATISGLWTRTGLRTYIDLNEVGTSLDGVIDIPATTTGVYGLGEAPPPPPTPSVQFGSASLSINEGGAVAIPVTLSNVSASQVVVSWSITGGTATNGTDYSTSTPTSLVIPAGQTSAQILLSTFDDATVEATETIVLTIGSAVGATLGGTTTCTVSLLSADSPTGFYDDSPTRFDAQGNNVTKTMVRAVTGIDPVAANSLPAFAVNGKQADVWPNSWNADGLVESVVIIGTVDHQAAPTAAIDLECTINTSITTPVSTAQYSAQDLSGLRFQLTELAGGEGTKDFTRTVRTVQAGNWAREEEIWGTITASDGGVIGQRTILCWRSDVEAVVADCFLENTIFDPTAAEGMYAEHPEVAGDVYFKSWRIKPGTLPAGWASTTVWTRRSQSNSELIAPESNGWHVIPARVTIHRRVVLYNPATTTEAQAKGAARDYGWGDIYDGDLSVHARNWSTCVGHRIPKVMEAYVNDQDGKSGREGARSRTVGYLTNITGKIATGEQYGDFVASVNQAGWHHAIGVAVGREGGAEWLRPQTNYFRQRAEVATLRLQELDHTPRHAVGMTTPSGDFVTAKMLADNNGGKAPWTNPGIVDAAGAFCPHFVPGVSPLDGAYYEFGVGPIPYASRQPWATDGRLVKNGPGAINPGIRTLNSEAPLVSLMPWDRNWNAPGAGAVVLERTDCFPFQWNTGQAYSSVDGPAPLTHYVRRMHLIEGLHDNYGGLLTRFLAQREAAHVEITYAEREVDSRGVYNNYFLYGHMPFHALADMQTGSGKLFWGSRGSNYGRSHPTEFPDFRIHRGFGEFMIGACAGARTMAPGARKTELEDWSVFMVKVADAVCSPHGIGSRTRPYNIEYDSNQGFPTWQSQWGITDTTNKTGAVPVHWDGAQSFWQGWVAYGCVGLERQLRPRGTFLSGLTIPHERMIVGLFKLMWDGMASYVGTNLGYSAKIPPAYHWAVTSTQGISDANAINRAPDGTLAGVGTGAAYGIWRVRHSTADERVLAPGPFTENLASTLSSNVFTWLGIIASYLEEHPEITNIPILDWMKIAAEGRVGEYTYFAQNYLEHDPTLSHAEAAGELWRINGAKHLTYLGGDWDLARNSTVIGWLQSFNELKAKYPHWSAASTEGAAWDPSIVPGGSGGGGGGGALPPPNIVSVTPQSGHALVTLENVDGAGAYYVGVGTASGNYTTVGSFAYPGNVVNQPVYSLSNGVRYYVAFRTHSVTGVAGAWGEEIWIEPPTNWSGGTPTGSPPPAPSNVTATAGNGLVVVDWDPVAEGFPPL